MNKNPQETQDTEILETVNHATKYGAQLAIVEKDFAQLFENSDMKKHLATLKRKYGGLKIESLEDIETYEEIKKAISVVRPLRTSTDKKRKEINKEAKQFIDTVNSMGAKIQEEIAKIEDNLWIQREKFEKLQEEAKEKAEREAKEKLDNRVKELIENGLRFDGFGYSINDINVGIQFIQELPDAEYETFLGKVKIQNELNIAEIKRKDDEAKEFQKIQDQLRLENEKKAKALQEQEDAINAKLKAIEDAEKELERKVKEQQELKEKQEREAKEQADRELLADRAKPFQDLGFIYNFNSSQWSLQIGQKAWTITAHTLLSNEYDFEEIKAQIEVATKAENERLAELENQKILNARYNDRKNELIELGFIQNGENSWFCNDIDFGLSTTDINSMTESYWYEFTNEAKAKWTMHNEKKRLAKLSEQQLFNEYISKIKAIEVPKLTDPMLLGLINKILDVIK